MEMMADKKLTMEALESVAGGIRPDIKDRKFVRDLLNRKFKDVYDEARGAGFVFQAAGVDVGERKGMVWAWQDTNVYLYKGKEVSRLDAYIRIARYVGKPAFDVTKYL